LTSIPQSRDGSIENDGLKPEVMYLSKLVWPEIIPTPAEKIREDEKEFPRLTSRG